MNLSDKTVKKKTKKKLNTMSLSNLINKPESILINAGLNQTMFDKSPDLTNLSVSQSFQALPNLQKKSFSNLNKFLVKTLNQKLQKSSLMPSLTKIFNTNNMKSQNQTEIEEILEYERLKTPKKRSISLSKPEYSITVPINQIIEENIKKPKASHLKILPLDIFDPIIEPLTPDKLLEEYKLSYPSLQAYSKWFFGNGTYEWRLCTIEKYDTEKELYSIVWPNGSKKSVSRINLRFIDEDEQKFEQRIAQARKYREEAEISLRYNFFIMNNNIQVPYFSIKIIENIIKYLKGKPQSFLNRYRTVETYSKMELSVKYNPKRFLWTKEISHLVDERFRLKSKGINNYSQFIQSFLEKTDFKKLFSNLKLRDSDANRDRFKELFVEIEENWVMLLKSLDFEEKNKKIVENSIFASKIINKSSEYRDHLSIKLPIISSDRFMPVFESFKQNSLQSCPGKITILQRIHDTILTLESSSVFPTEPYRKISLDSYIERLEKQSKTFFNLVQNVIFDIQCEIQKILTKEDIKRVRKNEKKIKERVHKGQVLDLEESLSEAILAYTKKLVFVCNMKIEDKVRECLNKSLKFNKKQFKVTRKVILPDGNCRPLPFEDLADVKGLGSNFLIVNILVNSGENKVVFDPSPLTIRTKVFNLINNLRRKLSELRCLTTIQTGPSRPNGMLQILEIDSEMWDHSIKSLEKNLDYQFTLLDHFIKKIEPYYFCISLNPGNSFKEFKEKSSEEIENEIYRLKRIQLEISEIFERRYASLGIWVINGKSVKKSFKKSTEEVLKGLFKLLLETCYNKVENTRKQYNEVLAVIDRSPANLEELDEMRKFINNTFYSKIDLIQSEITTEFNNLEILEGYMYYIPYDIYNKSWTTLGYTSNLQKIKNKSLKIIDELLVVFTQDNAEETNKLFADIEIMKQKLEELKLEKDIYRQEVVSLDFSVLNNDLKNAGQRAKVVNSRELVIGKDVSDFKVLDEIKKEFAPYCKLSFFIRDFLQRYPLWMSGPISGLNRDLVTKEINYYIREIVKMEKNYFKQNPAASTLCEEFLKKVNEFKPYIPVIRAFNNPGMKERHWGEFQQKSKISFSVHKNVSLKNLIEIDILEYVDLLETISELANKENGLENAKKKMENEWNTINFELSEYRGTYILINTQDIWDTLNEHEMRTISMLSSPYIKFIANELNTWKNNLLKMEDLLEKWESFQKTWQYLQPIFASNDISRQLPHAANKFRNINSHWENIMNGVASNPNAYEVMVAQPKIQEMFAYGNETLELILKNLNEYLFSKRKAFPRFYFLSNEELVLILSNSQDIISIQRYIVKCFEAIASVTIENKMITGMNSPEGEKVKFKKNIEFYIGDEIKSIETWMIDIEREMRLSLAEQLVEASEDSNSDLRTRVNKWPSQLLHSSLMSLWTWNVEQSVQFNTLKQQLYAQEEELNTLVDIVRGELSSLERLALSTMVVLDVHNKDIIENLVQRRVQSVDDFAWFSNMRYYLVAGVMRIHMLDCVREYGYEYLGNTTRLVITGLTDRCYRTLMSALNMSLGGAPEGPAGTGKTETTKDLAKCIAKKCVVFNCSDRLDHIYMAKFFTGLCYCGAWACFDEFNRIELEVLSVIAEQILSIQIAVQKKAESFYLEQEEVKLNPTCAVFITMNPDYAGRSRLPDNLKALFRPVAMMIPDYSMIAEIYLYSYGFREARNLSKKITNSLKLSSEQLSTQPHYDYGMRAVSTIIKAAGWYKQLDSKMDEDKLVLKAIKNINIPKFIGQDLPLFNGIVMDLFPEVIEENKPDVELETFITQAISDQRLVKTPKFVEKIVEIHSTVQLRHAVMIVGETMGGKTSALSTLAKALRYKKEVSLQFINPKSMTLKQLYGAPDPITQDWKDGVLASTIRSFSEQHSTGYQWAIFDGPVDAKWIESMNTVMDDNKKLCLSSGEIIKLHQSTRLVFEVDDLSQASPATVSRCGMVYIDAEDVLGPTPLITSWIHHPPLQFNGPAFVLLFENLFENVFMPCLDYWLKEIRPNTIIKCSIGHVTRNMIVLLQTLLLKKGKSRKQNDEEIKEYTRVETTKKASTPSDQYSGKSDVLTKLTSKEYILDSEKSLSSKNPKKEEDRVKCLFIVAAQWSLGGTCDESFKKLISKKISDLCKGLIKLPESLSESYYNDQDRVWMSWKTTLKAPLKQDNISSILVPTVSSVSYCYLLNELISRKENVLVVGDTGTGKTLLLNSVLQKLDPSFNVSATMFSARSGSNDVQSFIESSVVKRKKGFYGPEIGKFKIFLIDDLNMPAKEEYGAQPAVEFLRTVLERSEFYDRTLLDVKSLEDVQYIGAMGNPGGGRNTISNRFISKSFILSFSNYDTESLFLILSSLLTIGFSSYNNSIVNYIETLTKAVIKVFNQVLLSLPLTPTKSHYTFNLRDLANALKGVLLVPSSKLFEIKTLQKLWAHECLRVFSDRLIDSKDKEVLLNILAKEFQSNFKANWEEVVGKEVIFCNYLDDKNYQECSDVSKVKSCLENYLEEYNNEKSVKMNLIIFDYAIEHITRIARVLSWGSGNLLLIGVGGSGRMSLTKLSAFIFKMQVFQIKITKSYGMLEWAEDLKSILRLSGQEEKKIVFILRDSEIILESFLESINNILNTGQAPNLFTQDELQTINDTLKANKSYLNMNDEERFEVFVSNVKKNLHIVLCMFPQGEIMRTRLRNFPSLVNCCTIDWFTEWPEEALSKVSEFFIKEESLTDSNEQLQSAIKLCVNFHLSVRDLSKLYLEEYKRYNYVTPTHYLHLLKNLKNLYRLKEDTTIKETKKYSIGVQQLDQTELLVRKMKEDLTALKPILEEKTILAEETLKKIKEETAEADKTRNLVALEQESCEFQATLAQTIKIECEEALAKIIPELESAIKSLETIKRDDIDLVKTMHKPPEPIRLTLEAISIINRQKPQRIKDPDNPSASILDYYGSGKKMLFLPKFLQKLKTFDRDSLDEEIMEKISPYISMPKFHPDVVKHASSAAEGMCKWVRAMYKFYHVNKDIKPKKEALEEAEKNVKTKTIELAIKRDELSKIELYIQELKNKLDVQINEKNTLIEEIKSVEIKMQRAVRLIQQLSGERESWSNKIIEYSSDMKNLLGDVLVSAAVVSYMGPFIWSYREMALEVKWIPFIRTLKEIYCSENYSLSKAVGDVTTLQTWALSGLPSDKVSIENALIIHHAINWPLIIDPQGQASKWLKKMFSQLKTPNFKVKLESHDFMSILENALFLGASLLIEDIKETIDPVLDPLLMKQFYKQDSIYLIKIGDISRQYDLGFRLYLLSNYSNPHFSPEISTKVTLLNFTITEEGLSEQLLDIVCRKEMPKDTQERDYLIIQSAKFTQNLQAFEEKILSMLLSGGSNILDNELLINSLTESKSLSKAVEKKLNNAKLAEQKIFAIQSNYQIVSKQCSVLYFCVSDLANIDHMYQFSMVWFLYLFKKALSDSEKSKDVNERVKSIILKFCETLYTSIYFSLYEEDKILFAFLMGIKIQMFKGHVQPWQWKFFLTGICGVAGLDENITGFLSDKSWREVVQLNSQIKGLCDDVINDKDKWKNFVEAEKAFSHLPNFDDFSQILPDPYKKEVFINRLLIIRCLKPESLGIAIKSYIKSILGEKYLQPIVFSLNTAHKETSPLKPLVFILTPGADPQPMIKRFTNEMGIKLIAVSLGKGQGERAEKIIREASTEGKWVLLQNCHLAVSWLSRLELLLEEFSTENINQNFRLVLTAAPSERFSVNILQKSVKVISQVSGGISSSLLGIYSSISDSKEEMAFYESSARPEQWKKLFFNLSFFHCVIRERSLYGSIGWNIRYEFSESDLRISSRQLMQMINQFNFPPFEALIHLTAECNYGGKVTDDWDRRTLKEILQSFYSPEALKDSSGVSVPGYNFPQMTDFPSIINAIKAFPQVQSAEVFGLHPNAEISRSQKEAHEICSRLLALQPTAVNVSFDEEKVSIMIVSNMILSKVSSPFDINSITEKYPISYFDSMSTVLLHELNRYNVLINTISTTLKNLRKVYEGAILITPEYEIIAQSMLKNKIPAIWAKVSYTSNKSLVSWIEDLKKRIDFFNNWIQNGRPCVFWISGFFFTKSFLTATLQEYARNKKLPIDTLKFGFEILNVQPADAPEFGTYINGLFLEGARWNGEKLEECRLRELYFEFPVVLNM